MLAKFWESHPPYPPPTSSVRENNLIKTVIEGGSAFTWNSYMSFIMISGLFPIAQLVKNPPAMQETRFNSSVGKIPWRDNRLPTPGFLGFPCGSASEESACNVGDLGSIPGMGGSPGEGKGYLLQYPGLKNSMDCMYSPWGCKQSDTTEWLTLSLLFWSAILFFLT